MGMLFFVLFGCGIAVSTSIWHEADYQNSSTWENVTEPASLLIISLAFGIGLMMVCTAVGPISGAHLNPAVTLSFMILDNDMGLLKGVYYLLSQLIGALLGGILVKFSFDTLHQNPQLCNEVTCVWGDRPELPYALGAPSVYPGFSDTNAFFVEGLGTCILVMVVHHFLKHENLAQWVGITVFLCHLLFVPVTGCGINPARVFGPKMVNYYYHSEELGTYSLIYFIAPLVGSILASLLFYFFR